MEQYLSGIYNPQKCSVIYNTKGKLGILSNMSKTCPIDINGERIKTVTALYESLKYTHLPEIQERIILVHSPIDAINISKNYSSQTRRDWEEIKVYVMRWCIELKLFQNTNEITKVLKQTKTNIILYYSLYDDFWGATPREKSDYLIGKNTIGWMLTDIRDRLFSYPNIYSKKLSTPKYLDKNNNILDIPFFTLYNINIKDEEKTL